MALLLLFFQLLLALLVSSQHNVLRDATTTWDKAPGASTLPSGTASNCNHWYTIKKGDNCYTVETAFNIKHEDFIRWNAAVSDDCVTNFWLGYAYCVGVGPRDKPVEPTPAPPPPTDEPSKDPSPPPTDAPPEKPPPETTAPPGTNVPPGTGTPPPDKPPVTSGPSTNGSYSIINPITTWTPPPRANTTTTAPWPPTKTQPGQPAHCNNWYEVNPGDNCDRILVRAGSWVSLEMLLQWNPSLKDNCNSPFIGWWVCIGVESTETFTYIYPTNNTAPPPTSYTPPSRPPMTMTTFTPSPTQSGLATDCQEFYHATKGDTCSEILDLYEGIVDNKRFHEINPALGPAPECTGLKPDYYYCVMAYPDDNPPMPPTVTTAPMPPPSDTAKNCTTWYQAVGIQTCQGIISDFGTFTEEQFIAWNPSVASRCNSLPEDTWYCVADADTPLTRTAPYDPGPTAGHHQPNVTQSCNKWWFVGLSDSCKGIALRAGISEMAFYEWNPDVSSERYCDNLIAGSEVCVGVSPNGTIPVPSSNGTIPVPTTPGKKPTLTPSKSPSFRGPTSGSFSVLPTTPLPTEPDHIISLPTGSITETDAMTTVSEGDPRGTASDTDPWPPSSAPSTTRHTRPAPIPTGKRCVPKHGKEVTASEDATDYGKSPVGRETASADDCVETAEATESATLMD
ncbi:uncharacterized protein BDW47DRAFT_132571 [Aspergillus candidus]|uniref:LysM domain-containing protein n=1 Tax=Aspergillus candidus TaxID=41067 RepID=A0A2I2F812_ASPCN|nr:hypothetical protein BDW47DRAFT_132571 [Aspergillus candidus]PLB36765.1 hypothetical protein BDW47DRAFT_132571 [Aspergillus candidus]